MDRSLGRAGVTWHPPGGAATSCSHETPVAVTRHRDRHTTIRHRSQSSTKAGIASAAPIPSQHTLRPRRTALQAASTAAAPTAEAAPQPSTPDTTPCSVVRITVVKDLPRFDMPLLLGSVQTVTRSAVAITHNNQRYLITTASSVVYALEIKVHVDGVEQPYSAHVAHLCMEPDLALLHVEAPESDMEEDDSQAATADGTGAGQTPAGGTARRGSRLRGRAGRARGRANKADSTGSQAAAEDNLPAPDFWDVVTPVSLGPLPRLQDPVTVMGPRQSSKSISASMSVQGSVSTVEVVTYPLASYRLLGLGVRAAVPREGLGSAVVDREGRCVGVAFHRVKASGRRGVQRRRGSGSGRRGATAGDQVHACPAPVIRHVLEDIEAHGQYMGFAQLGIRYKHCESPQLRSYLGMRSNDHGVIVLDLNPTSPVAVSMRQGDVIMSLEGESVGDDGTMDFELGGRLSITHKVTQWHVGHTADLTVLRERAPQELKLELGVPHRLLPTHLSGQPPSYLVIGGLVLTVLTVPYMEQCFGPQWLRSAPPLLAAVAGRHPECDSQQVVVVAHCEENMKCMQGYRAELIEQQRVVGFRIPSANADEPEGGGSGTEADASHGSTQVVNLRQLAQAVLACKEGDLHLELGDGTVVVLSAAQAAADARALIAEYEVSKVVSTDMVDLLPQTATRPLARLSRGGGSGGRSRQ